MMVAVFLSSPFLGLFLVPPLRKKHDCLSGRHNGENWGFEKLLDWVQGRRQVVSILLGVRGIPHCLFSPWRVDNHDR